MTTIIHRSALIFHGHQVPDDLAYVEVNPHRGGRRIVTWGEVLQKRREWQAELLRRKRYVEPWRAVKLWVAFFDQFIFGGWQAFIEDSRGRNGSIWIDRDGKHFVGRVMEMFPLVLPIGTERDRWEQWKPLFARQCQRGTHDRKPRGVAFLWKRGYELARSPHGD